MTHRNTCQHIRDHLNRLCDLWNSLQLSTSTFSEPPVKPQEHWVLVQLIKIFPSEAIPLWHY